MVKRSYRFLDPDSKKLPPEYGSRSVKRKLMLLVAALGLVIVLMAQAGNPENWNWLSELDQQRKLSEKLSFETPKVNKTAKPPQINNLPELTEIDAFGKKFWAETFLQMTEREQFALVSFIEGTRAPEIANDQSDGENESEEEQTKRETTKEGGSGDFQVKMPLQGDGDDQSFRLVIKNQANRYLQQEAVEGNVQSYLKRLIKAAEERSIVKSNKGFWDHTQRNWIDPAVLQTITDGSFMGYSKERAAVLRFFSGAKRRIALSTQNGAASNSNSWQRPEEVVNTNLIAQPELFRGQVIKFDGVVNLVRKRNIRQPETKEILNADYCYECWIATKWAGKVAINLWCPPGGPAEKNLAILAKEEKKVSVPVEVKGLFFKKSIYDAGESQPTSLVLFAPDLNFLSAGNAVAAKDGGWGSYQSLGALFLVLMLAMILWRSYQSIQGRPKFSASSSRSKDGSSAEDESARLNLAEIEIGERKKDWSHLASGDKEDSSESGSG